MIISIISDEGNRSVCNLLISNNALYIYKEVC